MSIEQDILLKIAILLVNLEGALIYIDMAQTMAFCIGIFALMVVKHSSQSFSIVAKIGANHLKRQY